MSECGTWSHAVFPALGARARRGGGRAPAFRVAHCRTQSGVRLDGLGWVPLGPVRVRQGPVWSRIGPYIMQSYSDTGQSSDPSGLVGSRRAISGSDGFPSEPCFGTTGPVGARRIARLSLLGTPRRPHGLPGLVGTQRTPGGTLGPINRSLPGLGGPQLLLAQPVLL